MPSARVRFAGEAALLVLVAMGLGLAGFSPIVIGAVMFVAWILVAMLERASAKEAARARDLADGDPLAMPSPHVERVEMEPATREGGHAFATSDRESAPAPEAAASPEPVTEPEPAVDERSARAILASGPPPLPPEPPQARRRPQRRGMRRPAPPRAAPPPPPPPPEPEPAAEVVPVVTGPPRQWNVWELQRAVRDSQDDGRREEWNALLIHLREFANADGDLPVEFDGLVRESFGSLIAAEREAAAAT